MSDEKRAQPPWVGVDDIVIALGLLLLTIGLWSRLGAIALTVPGGVLLWMALPPRRSFVIRDDVTISGKGRS